MKRVAHIGCGPARVPAVLFPAETWSEIRVDIDPDVCPDVVAPMNALPFADGAIDAVYTAHTLEHLHAHDVPAALAELKRVLCVGGAVVIQVPDLQDAAAEIAAGRGCETLYEAPCGPITAMDVVFGHAGMSATNDYMMHRCGFTADTLHALMCEAGFDGVHVLAAEHTLHGMGVKRGDCA